MVEKRTNDSPHLTADEAIKGGRLLAFSDSRPFEAGKVYSAADVFALGRGIDPHTDAGRQIPCRNFKG